MPKIFMTTEKEERKATSEMEKTEDDLRGLRGQKMNRGCKESEGMDTNSYRNFGPIRYTYIFSSPTISESERKTHRAVHKNTLI